MKLIIIVAADEDGAIGQTDGSVMWKLSDDLKIFKQLTSGFPIIMGYTTHLSIGRILPNRPNIILTRKKSQSVEGALIASNIDESLELAAKYSDTVFIIGGEEVFNEFLPIAEFIYLSRVHGHVGGDKYFFYNSEEWTEISSVDYFANENNTHDFTFKTLQSVNE